MNYTEPQLAAIEQAVIAGRDALLAQGRFEPLVFARAFVAAGGIQIPDAGASDVDLARRIGEALALELQRAGASPPDIALHVRREAYRAGVETGWARAAASDRVVGFHVEPGPAHAADPRILQILGRDLGLGAAVVPKDRVLVLPPDCIAYRCTPVREDEVEM